MPAVGVSGHMDLTASTAEQVRRAIGRLLTSWAVAEDLIGVSCLAPGADTIFADEVLAFGGSLVAVLPAADATSVLTGADRRRMEQLLAQADEVVRMPFERSGPVAYAAANEALLARVDRLLAVWDGQPSPDRGGTGAVVAAARARGLPVHVVWPAGARRSGPGR